MKYYLPSSGSTNLGGDGLGWRRAEKNEILTARRSGHLFITILCGEMKTKIDFSRAVPESDTTTVYRYIIKELNAWRLMQIMGCPR